MENTLSVSLLHANFIASTIEPSKVTNTASKMVLVFVLFSKNITVTVKNIVKIVANNEYNENKLEKIVS